MAAPRQFRLSHLEIEDNLVRDAFRCIVHTIIFNRALGPVTPRDGVIESLDLYYVHVDDAEVIKKVDQGCDLLVQQMRATKKDSYEMSIAFFERRQVKGWLGTSTEDICWEQWVLSFSPRQQTNHSYDFAEELRRRLSEVVDNVSRHKSHIPPMTQQAIENKRALPFHFQIISPAAGSSAAGRQGANFLSDLFASAAGANIISY